MAGEIEEITVGSVLKGSGHRFRKEVMKMPLASIKEITDKIRLINNLRGKETETMILSKGHFRPRKNTDSPTGTGELVARTLETNHLHVWEEFDPEELYGTVFDNPVSEGMINNDMVRELLVEEMRQCSESLCETVFKGVYDATGDDNLDNFDGFDTIIAKEKEAGNIAPSKGNYYQMGEVNVSNIGDKLRTLWNLSHAQLKGNGSKKLMLMMPRSMSEMYDQWHANNYGTANFTGDQYHQKYLEGSSNQCEIVSLPGMEGMQHIWITTWRNMKLGYDASPNFNKYEIDKGSKPFLISMYAQIFMGVDFASLDQRYIMVGSCDAVTHEVYVVVDPESVEFEDTNVGSSKTATVNVQGINLTSSLSVTVEGDSEFTSDKSTITAADANDEGGVDVTVTFEPTEAGDFSGKLKIKSATDDVCIRVALSGKGLSVGG